MKKCRTCAHWLRETEPEEHVGNGMCQAPAVMVSLADDDGPQLTDPQGVRTFIDVMETGPEFGCVNWEKANG